MSNPRTSGRRAERERGGSPPIAAAASPDEPLLPAELVAQLPAIVYVAAIGMRRPWSYVSPGIEAILGFSVAEWLADPAIWSRHVHAEDRARVLARKQRLGRPGEPDEYRMLHRDGRVVWVRDDAVLVDGASGQAWHGVICDVTARKLAEMELERRAVQRHSTESELRRALDRDELELIYQPIVSLARGTLAAVEALLRWRHPQRGLVGPDEFVSVAEECGLIEPIGRWVLERACAQAARWHREHRERAPLGVCVNVSLQQLHRRELEAAVGNALAANALDPASLRIELAESVLLDHPGCAQEALRRLAQHGVRLVLDDFGAGRSSLRELANLPIDGLKIDRFLVAALDRDEHARTVTTAAVRLAQALRLEVTAKGVENDRQAQALRALGCDLAQGFGFHRPLAAAGISKLLDGERDSGAGGYHRKMARERSARR